MRRARRSVGVLGYELAAWGGGVDFLHLVLKGLAAWRGPDDELDVLLPRGGAGARLRATLFEARRVAGERLRGRASAFHVAMPPDARVLAPGFAVHGARVRAVSTSRLGSRLGILAGRYDVVLPAMTSLGRRFPTPWVGYLYDFQHRHLPRFFDDAERARRDREFATMLDEATVVVCNSRAVRDDAMRFAPRARAEIVAMPFAPAPLRGWLELDVAAAKRRHGVRRPYFAVCNQLWAHKDHATAVRALRVVLDELAGAEVDLVCTGKLDDFRAPGQAERLRGLVGELGLERRVHLLGHVSKDDQIALVRGAIAVVQPTLFEGGPGGGAVFDAVAVGTRAIASDLEVNREIDDPSVSFFRAGDPRDLARSMLAALEASPSAPEAATLIERGRVRLAALGAALDRAMGIAIAAR